MPCSRRKKIASPIAADLEVRAAPIQGHISDDNDAQITRLFATRSQQPLYFRDPAAHRVLSKPVKKPVREEHVPGEGMCYIYNDGSRVKKLIDGESVNAQWGVTKAGKPRKRLAVACLTCREKKIKCEPGEDKCTQSEKSGHDCSYYQA